MSFLLSLFLICVAGGLNVCAAEIDFSHEIVPILNANCVTCHGGRESEGDFSLNTRESLVDSGMVDIGDAAASHLVDLIASDDTDIQMPPSDRPRMSDREIQLIRRWIDEGMKWEPGFSFEIRSYEPPVRPRLVTLPPPTPGREHPIDRLLDRYLAERDLNVPATIDDAAFLRRVHLDLIGLLPTPEQYSDFLASGAEGRREKLIDDLLSRRIEYADHWLTFFNDLLRNDYSGTGFITGGRKQVTEWLYSALLANKPFDEMTRELVAPPTAASQGFIDGIKWRGEVSAGQTNEIQFSQSISQSFLGINMKCASCHDSFIDRWTLKEAYGLAAVYADAPLELHRCDKPTGETQAAAWLYPELGQIDPSAPRAERLRQLAGLMTDPQNARYARTIVNRLWNQMMGRGLVHPLDAMQTEPWNEELLDFLANDFVANGYDLKSTLRLIATSEAYQSRTEIVDGDDGGQYVYRGPRQRRLTAEQFVDAVWQLCSAAPTKFDAPVLRSTVTDAEIAQTQITGKWIWGKLQNGSSPGGEELLIRKTIELPADVSQGGAVITCDNEYVLYVGNRQIIAGTDWTQPQAVSMTGVLKKGSNQIVIKAKNAGAVGGMNPAGLFFQASLKLTDGSEVSIASDETWQYNPEVPESREGRMSAPKQGWQPVTIVPGLDVWNKVLDEQARRLLAPIMTTGSSGKMIRASLMKNTPLMQSLGRPLREQIVSMRPDGLTTLEAIDLANAETLTQWLAQGAEHWSARDWQTSDALVEEMFVAALSRQPTPGERNLLVAALGERPDPQSVQDVMWTILMLPEFMLVR
ncbi:DUF1549 domain-containing protein [Stieleria varia]|nr:DUF1549 domain-containing protein [Stieleria varia]